MMLLAAIIYLILGAYVFFLGACAWLVIGIVIDVIWGLE